MGPTSILTRLWIRAVLSTTSVAREIFDYVQLIGIDILDFMAKLLGDH